MFLSDRLWLKSIYESTANVVKADGLVGSPTIVTLGDWLKIYGSIKKFIWSGMSTVCPIVYPGLMAAVDREIANALEGCTGEITPEIRKRLVKSLDRVAWTGLGGDE